MVGDPSDELRESLTSLEQSAILVRGICRSLVELDTVTGGRGPTRALRAALARLLEEVADAVRTFGEQVAASVPGPPVNQAPSTGPWPEPEWPATSWPRRWPPAPARPPEPGRSTATSWPTSTASSTSSTPKARPGPAPPARTELGCAPAGRGTLPPCGTHPPWGVAHPHPRFVGPPDG